jgi:hypothetical protein
MSPFIDHLWQSTWYVVITWLFARVVRSNMASLRLWMWRIAALKFLLPFAWLYSLGGWLGFPVRHSAIPPPQWLTENVASALPWMSPAQSFASGIPERMAGLAAAMTLAVFSGRLIRAQLRRAREQRDEEARRIEVSWRDTPPPLGFLQTAAMAGMALVLIVVPVLAGAVQNRLDRQAALAVDTESLRSAKIQLTETDWRFGDRTEVLATHEGVTIRKINLQDLVALVYGIGQFEVFGGALPWLETPHYDVRVTGPVIQPAIYDPYSLRQPLTEYLNQEFGVSIRVNGRCQEPCLNQESFIVERLPWKILDSLGKPPPAAQPR